VQPTDTHPSPLPDAIAARTEVASDSPFPYGGTRFGGCFSSLVVVQIGRRLTTCPLSGEEARSFTSVEVIAHAARP